MELWFAARGEFPFAGCSSKKLVLGRRCEGTSAELAQGAWLGPGRRRPSRAQSCFPTKENPWGVGFGHRRPPAKQQGPGSRGRAVPVRPMESGWPGAKTACVAFSIRGALGLWFAARGEFPFAECSCQKIVWGRRCEGASALSGRAGSGGMAGPKTQKDFVRPILLPHEGEPVGSGFRAPETPSKAAGPREPGAGQPRFALWRAWGRGRQRLVLLSGSEAHWGCGLLPEECFTLQNAVPRSSFWVAVARGPLR